MHLCGYVLCVCVILISDFAFVFDQILCCHEIKSGNAFHICSGVFLNNMDVSPLLFLFPIFRFLAV